jgi:radical SAM protein with 4Fe4S-binding SPASM domain
MVKLAKSLGLSYDADPVISPKDNGDKTPLKFRASDDDLEGIYRQTLKGVKITTSHICSFARSMCTINAYGDLLPCVQLPVSAGNVNEEEFEKIWKQSRLLKELRNYSLTKLKNCRRCNLLPYCRRCPGLAFLEGKGIYGISPEACRHARIVKRVLR